MWDQLHFKTGSGMLLRIKEYNSMKLTQEKYLYSGFNLQQLSSHVRTVGVLCCNQLQIILLCNIDGQFEDAHKLEQDGLSKPLHNTQY